MPSLEEKQEARAKQMTMARDAVEAMRESEAWKTWLRCRKLFRQYSAHNQILLACQAPDAKQINSAKRWLALGYIIRKGEKALRIWGPVTHSKKYAEQYAREHAGKTPPRAFRLVPVFADFQVQPLTDGTAQPLVPPGWEDTLAMSREGLLEELTDFMAGLGVPVRIEDHERFANGAHGSLVVADGGRPQHIRLADIGTDTNKAAVLLHEATHALVRLDKQPGDPHLSYAQEEVIAETIAWAVMDTLGIDTTGKSMPYLAGWSKGKEGTELLLRNVKLIDRLAGRLEDAVMRGEHAEQVAS